MVGMAVHGVCEAGRALRAWPYNVRKALCGVCETVDGVQGQTRRASPCMQRAGHRTHQDVQTGRSGELGYQRCSKECELL